MTGHHSWHTSLIKAVIGSAQVQGDGEIGILSEFVAIFPVYNLCLLISRKGEAANWELGWDQDGSGTRDSIRHILAVVAPQVSFTSLKVHSIWTAALLISSPFLYITLRRRQWHPTPVLLPGKSHWRRSLVGESMGSWRVGHDWATSLSLFTFMQWRRKWQPTPVFLPGESQGRGSLVDCHLWGHTESDTTDAT